MSGDKRRVLIVDSAPSVTESLKMIFDRVGCDCRTAHSAEEALALGWTPDAVIIEFILQNMNGLECAKLLRDRHPNCGMILIYAQVADCLIRDAEEAGFQVFAKPVSPQVLMSAAGIKAD